MTENDPTAIDPDEPREDVEQPAKPTLDLPPEDGVDPPSDDDEQDIDEGTTFMPADEAAADDTVDDLEPEEPRHDDLPEGAHAEDYDDEADEG
jgi:hypothetical protein